MVETTDASWKDQLYGSLKALNMPIRNGHVGLARFREALLGSDALKE